MLVQATVALYAPDPCGWQGMRDEVSDDGMPQTWAVFGVLGGLVI